MRIEDFIVLAIAGGIGYLIYQHATAPVVVSPTVIQAAIPTPTPNTVGTIGTIGSCTYTAVNGKIYQGVLASGYSGNQANLNGCMPQMEPA